MGTANAAVMSIFALGPLLFWYQQQFGQQMPLYSANTKLLSQVTTENKNMQAVKTMDESGPSNPLNCVHQSYSFFDDISNKAWERMREKAQSFVQFANPDNPDEGVEQPLLWNIGNIEPSFTCPHVQRVGGLGDGAKWICDPHRLMNKDCLVYSVGSRGKYEFEDGLSALLDNHCEIHVFDPENYARPGDAEKRNIHYHQYGLKAKEDDTPQSTTDVFNDVGPAFARGMAFNTFEEIIERLGHQNRTIDISKMDCEGCEWKIYKELLQQDIRQVMLETHGTPRGTSNFFQSFFDHGFGLFSKEQNPWGHGDCLEYSFVKLHMDFWRKDIPNV